MENKPQIPTLKESQKDDKKGAPPLRIKGLQSGLSLIDRLKQFKKKDLAFILAGLGVLFMAPLAEHFMMAPDNGQGDLTPGFSKNGSSPFGSGSSPYEPGISGLAPGGAPGSGSDVITPLNVRDPSALVMGPGATQQAPATASSPIAPPPPPPSKEDSKWNDAIAAGKAAASSAVHKAALPVPKVPLSAGGLRGLGAVSGGSGSQYSLPAISSNGLAPNGVNQSHGLTGSEGSGFKGVARGPGSGGNSKNLEALKAGAANAGADFNRAGSAATNLEQAAASNMGDGSAGSGGAGENGGAQDKAASGSQNKDSKTPGESLEFLRQKEQMEKDIAFADELRKNDPNCLFKAGPCMERNKILSQGEETLIGKGLFEPFAAAMADAWKGILEPDSASQVICISDDHKISQGPMKKPGPCGVDQKHDGDQAGTCLGSDNKLYLNNGANPAPGNLTCYGSDLKGGDTTPDPTQTVGNSGVAGASNVDTTAQPTVKDGIGKTLPQMCQDLDKATKLDNKVASGGGVSHSSVDDAQTAQNRAAESALLQDASDMAAIEAVLSGQSEDYQGCEGYRQASPAIEKYLPRHGTNNVKGLLLNTQNALQQNLGYLQSAVFGSESTWQPKIHAVGDESLEQSTAKTVGDALKPETVNKETLAQAADAIKKLESTEADALKAADAAAQAWQKAGHPDASPWTDTKKNLDAIQERLNAMLSEVGRVQGDAQSQQTVDKPYGLQIGDAEGNKWMGVVKDQLAAYQQQRQAYDTVTSALAPGQGTLALAHADAQAQLKAGGDGTPSDKGVQPLLAQGGHVVDSDQNSFSGALLKAVETVQQNPSIPATPAAAASLGSDAAAQSALQQAVAPAQSQVDAAVQAAESSNQAVMKNVSGDRSPTAPGVQGIYSKVQPLIGTVPTTGVLTVPTSANGTAASAAAPASSASTAASTDPGK